MLQRRQLGSLVGGAAASMCFPGSGQAATRVETLFKIARSKNKNVVVYRAHRRDQGLDASRPISAHWLMLAEDGRHEELTWAERKLAYGFEVTDLATDHCRLSLTACQRRSISVERRPEGFRALCQIGGQRALLERIFVQAHEGALLPSVQHVDLFGKSLAGAPVAERLLAR
jgi:hypothetical protein